MREYANLTDWLLLIDTDEHIYAEHDGATYNFAASEAKEKFVAKPEDYVPAFGGYCGKAVSENEIWWVDPLNFLLV